MISSRDRGAVLGYYLTRKILQCSTVGVFTSAGAHHNHKLNEGFTFFFLRRVKSDSLPALRRNRGLKRDSLVLCCKRDVLPYLLAF